MLADHLPGVPYRGQVEGPVPLSQQTEIIDEFFGGKGWQRYPHDFQTTIEAC
jgi:hypothetical protein